MSMPESGCITLRTCITGIDCSSIACAVNGGVVSNCCLSLLSITAGKSTPHAMREFYGYPNTPVPIEKRISYTCIAGFGHDGSSDSVGRTLLLSSTPVMEDDESYNIIIKGRGMVEADSGGYVSACIVRGTTVLWEFNTTSVGQNYTSDAIVVNGIQSFCVVIEANSGDYGGAVTSSISANIWGISPIIGDFIKSPATAETQCIISSVG